MSKGVKSIYTYVVERTKTTSRIKRLAVVLIAVVLASTQIFALLGGNTPADRNLQSQAAVNSSIGAADTASLESSRSLATGSTLVNDTFADSNSQNQDLANNSLRVFNGRAGTIRTDAPGSATFDMTNAGGSELTLNVRAERDNKGTGRIYTITVESRDDAGNVAERSR